MKPKTFLSALVLNAMLGACSLAPDYKPPEMPAPPPYKETGDWMPAHPADDIPRGAWWKIYNDPQLDALEDQVTAANQNLKIALAQYQEARAAASSARAAYFPLVTGDAGATRQKLSSDTANRATKRTYNDFTLGADMSYEIDLWGRVRNAVSAATSQAEASKADLAGVDLSLHAELAMDYFTLRGDDALQDLLDRTVDVDQKALDLVQKRLEGGIATSVDADQAETQFQNAKAQASDTRLHRAQLEHAIAVLTGQVPANFKLTSSPLGEVAPPLLAPGLPSTLLERRPDIAAAERRTAAANAEIGVARAAWFPTFSLTGSFGFEGSGTSNWFNLPGTFWSLGPSALLTVFDAGRISALTDEARAAYEENAAGYRQTVLAAYQEVEDNLAAMHHLAEESESQKAAADAAGRSLAQENNLYQGGAATYIDVAVAQTTALQAGLADINVRVRRMTASIQLIKALGGGWQVADIKN